MLAHLITLEETPERETHAITQLEKMKINYKIHRFKKHPSSGWKGCISSHLFIYKKGADEKQEKLFICEDNILAYKEFEKEKYKNLDLFFETCHDWQVIFVGGYILRFWDYCLKTPYKQVYETRNNNHGTVSYFIHERGYKKILELNTLSPINIHFDIFLSQLKCYIYNPLLFYHAHNVKSTINPHADWWREYMFHPKIMNIKSVIFFNQGKSALIIGLIIFALIIFYL